MTTRLLSARLVLATCLVAVASCVSVARSESFADWAPTPPRGWNSWDCYGDSVTEEEVLSNAEFMAERLAEFGWEYVVVDIRWTVQNPGTRPYNQTDPVFTVDGHGRFMPAPNRFPSAAGGRGFKPLADKVQDLGLRFGIHLMRGLPRAAIEESLGAPAGGYPIEGSAFKTSDIPLTDHGAVWLRDMRGMQKSEAAQDYYDSLMRLYASWGVDFIKVDDLNNPYAQPGQPNYSGDEIEMLRAAIDRCGREIVLSTSPGPTPIDQAEHISRHANLWRVSNDFWDEWPALERQFEQLHLWTPYRSEGHWPDGDMLPLGRLAIRGERGGERGTRFTPAEQRTLMTAWCIAKSPLIFGGDLPSSDAATIELITNPEVLKVNDHGVNPKQVARSGSRIVWTADAPAGGKYVAVIRLSETGEPFEDQLDPQLVGLTAPVRARDLWAREDLGEFAGAIPVEAEPHGSRLLLIEGADAPAGE
ncbi:glycoside hydrolase family 27 protein [Botrimarina mediterranea]|uniref:Alpha-galactosidase n=1 Tax=Botrimarina mediterranea TaxID=2528022 RepID=A0A518K7V0_9BACT|nr:glycoside hydrolase family 27 protein [Botrimarina mediterranea]QDV73878.1 Alpha-galactosidase A precursor [Botrimarina mediterranea]